MLTLVLAKLVTSVPMRLQAAGQGPTGLAEKAQEPLSPWALAVFIWLVLFLTMAFVVAVGWLTRPRRP